MNPFLTRSVSALLFAVALITGFAGSGSETAAAQTRQAIGSVEVDVSALRAKGVGVFADLIGDQIQRELKAIYPAGRGGPRLVVSLDALFLTGSPEDGGVDGVDSFSSNDSLGGTNYLIGTDGRVIVSYPLSITSPANRAGPSNLPLENERASILAQVYAQWLVRQF